MKQSTHYHKLLARYQRSKRKLQRLISEDTNSRKQDILQRRIIRLLRMLKGMQRSLRLKMAAAAMSAGMLLFQPNASQGQTIVFGNNSITPGLTGVGGNYEYYAPAVVDLDGDGDTDILAGAYYGDLYYYQNTGSPDVALFTSPITNPFGLTNLQYSSSPSFADLDNDGDEDLLVGNNSGNFYYFQNTGSDTLPFFAPAQTNQFGLTDIGSNSAPTMGDLDADGDLDLLAGAGSGNFSYFQNTGDATFPSFAAAQTNPFGLTVKGEYPSPVLIDLDSDGDLDLLSGTYYGNYYYFQNTGTNSVPVFALPVSNPFWLNGNPGEYNFGSYEAAPAFADLDDDGDMDLIAGNEDGFSSYENIGTLWAPAFITASPSRNPFDLPAPGDGPYYYAPSFVDLDGDGDLDILSGNDYGDLLYYENLGSTNAPYFASPINFPFGLTDIFLDNSSPSFADLDGDADMDLISGSEYGNFFHFQNIGTSSVPAFSQGEINDYGLTEINQYSIPFLADLDADGDVDLIAGDISGNFYYFQNIGNPTAPAFDIVQLNPFGLTDVGSYSSPALGDLDADGDLDLLAGDKSGKFFYFQNTGTASSPSFAPMLTNPYSLGDIGTRSIITLADLDDDGDFDVMASRTFYFSYQNSYNYYTDFIYYENTSCLGKTAFEDVDQDGFGNGANSYFAVDCILPTGFVLDSTDCNDSNASINPEAIEICDSIDNNCDGITDPGITFYADADQDNYGNVNTSTVACMAPAGYVTDSTDCNDINFDVNPSATEICDGIDNNCDGLIDPLFTFYADVDGDNYGNINSSIQDCIAPSGYVSDSIDCDDNNSAVNPSATEVCNNIDDNCLNGIDDGLVFTTYYADADADNFGETSLPVSTCNGEPAGYVADNTDCNDADAAINPSATEICNNIDDNCVNGIDDGLIFITYYADADADNFGDASSFVSTCDGAPVGYVPDNKDCNDSNAAINPSAIEICNNADDNCVNGIDDGLTFTTYYLDADVDNFGNASSLLSTCNGAPVGYVTDNTDCNDANAATNPSATETCDGIDNNCNASIDEGFLFTTYYQDVDGDGYGNPLVIDSACGGVPSGFVVDNTDCNDANANAHPGATEITNNGIDDNCDGYIDEFGVGIDDPNAVGSFLIYPNPAEKYATIEFILSKTSNVSIKIFDINGKEMQSLVNEWMEAGEHALLLNTALFAKGVYLVRMISEEEIKNQKLVIQ